MRRLESEQGAEDEVVRQNMGIGRERERGSKEHGKEKWERGTESSLGVWVRVKVGVGRQA